MTVNKRALQSGVWYTISSVLVKGINFLSVPIFARLISKGAVGDYSNYTSIISIGMIIITLNMEASFISAKHDYKESFDDYVFSILVLMFLFVGLWSIALILYGNQISQLLEVNKKYLSWMIICILFSSVINVYQIKMRFLYKYKISTFVSVGLAIGTIVLSVGLVSRFDDKVFARILGSTIPVIATGILLFFSLFKKGHKIKVSYWKYAFPLCLPYVPHLLSLSVLNSVDKIMITKICGSEANALYTVAYTAGQIITVLLTSMNQAYAPWLGDQLASGNYKEIKKFSYIYITAFSIMAVGLMLLAPEVLLLLGGNGYEDAIYVVSPVAMGCVCQFLYTMFVNIEQFKKKTVGMAVGSMVAALVNYILNLIFIPIYGYVAAAYTTFVGFLFLLIVHMIIVYKLQLNFIYNYKFILLCLFVIFVFSIGCNFLYNNRLARYAGIVIYVFIISVLLTVKRKKLFGLIKRSGEKWKD